MRGLHAALTKLALWPQVDVAPPGVLATTMAEVRAVLGAAAAGGGVAAGVPAGARGAVDPPLVTSEEQVRHYGRLHCPWHGLCGGRCRIALWASAGCLQAYSP